MSESLLEAPEQVLSTLNPDGTRRWLRPKAAMGKWWKQRRVVAWLLMIMFTAIPWMRIGGEPIMLFDVMHRDFVFFTVHFRPTETILLAFLLFTIFFGVFFLTALLGRGWCGWACPQTVYLEFLYRPVERWAEGSHGGRAKKDIPVWRRVLKYTVFAVLSIHLSNTFLSYFVGPEQVWDWSLSPPSEHPAAFAIVMGTAALMMFDFTFFREQMCTLVCPYARLQSALLDRDSIIIGYDEKRGEPRGKRRKNQENAHGDCIDCNLCVAACPTGIDIRNGLQLECIACAQCIDACDTVMDKIGSPRGLIRYTSQNVLAGLKQRFIRVRTLVYPAIILVTSSALVMGLVGRESAEVNILRVQEQVWTVQDSNILNPVQIRIDNKATEDRTYSIEISSPTTMLTDQFPVTVPPREGRSYVLLLSTPIEGFDQGRTEVHLRVFDGVDFEKELEHVLLGPLEGAR